MVSLNVRKSFYSLAKMSLSVTAQPTNKWSLIVFLLVLSLPGFGQITQKVRLEILDNATQKTLKEAKVSLLQGGKSIEATFDSVSNVYLKDSVALGRYQLVVQHPNFRMHTSLVLLDASRSLNVKVLMQSDITTLDEVAVHHSSGSKINGTSSKIFTVEETQRYAASFYDPARLVMAFPGVVATDDQANNISIRGNSPNALAWRLEGVEILNPNHLTNAGTFTDRPTTNGGGTIMLSAQLLDNSQFISGGLAPEYGGSTGGLFDMSLRKGDNQKRHYTAQAGLLGVDLSAEGPFSKKGKASYLVNYRYSFTGLLNKLGVSFGDEAIGYNDLAFNLSFPTKRLGDFTAFGLFGKSFNQFKKPEDRARETQKDFYIIDYESDMQLVGITHALRFGDRFSLRNVISYNTKKSFRWQSVDLTSSFLPNNQNIPFVNSSLKTNRLTISSIARYNISKKIYTKTGFYLNDISENLNDTYFNPINGFKTNNDMSNAINGLLSQAFTELNFSVKNKLSGYIGLQTQFFTSYKNDSKSIEPRIGLHYLYNANNSFSTSISQQGQLANIALEKSKNEFNQTTHYVINWEHKMAKNNKLKLEAYYQNHTNLHVNEFYGNFSSMNLYDEFLVPLTLKTTGTAYTKGVEFSLEKPILNSFYYLINATVYDSKYLASDNVWRNTRFNGNFASNITIGKEWTKTAKKHSTKGFNLKAMYTGGQRETSVDLEASKKANETIFNENYVFDSRLPNYKRIDLRLYAKKQKVDKTRTWSVDIQNVMNFKNEAYHYYDFFTKKIETKYQLGMIPVLNYRLEF
jgi:hypothetical protein